MMASGSDQGGSGDAGPAAMQVSGA